MAKREKIAQIHAGKTPIRIHYIPEWAHRRHVRQKDITRELGVDKATVSRWFKGALPSEKWLAALATFLGADEPAALFRHPDNDWIARLLRRGSEEQQRRVRDALEALFG